MFTKAKEKQIKAKTKKEKKTCHSQGLIKDFVFRETKESKDSKTTRPIDVRKKK